jgi:sec-independent protein translocase protein TatB
MFDFGFSEIVLTSAIALIVLGPEKLPKVARQVGNWMGRARSMARQLTEQLEREVDAEDLLKQTKTNSIRPAATHPGSASAVSSAPVPFDTSSYAPSSGPAAAPVQSTPVQPTAAQSAPAQSAPAPFTPGQSAPGPGAPEPTYSAQPSSPPHGADWHPAPPENKSSDG